MTIEQNREDVLKLGKWFHNIDLTGMQTAPDHFLRDYPNVKFMEFAQAIPADLRGKTVPDIGCNAGFYSFEMKNRCAERVLAIDAGEKYLNQARSTPGVLGSDIKLRNMSVYGVGTLGVKFNLIIMGVLYHLCHPLLALDLLYGHVLKDTLLFQLMQRGSNTVKPLQNDYPSPETGIFERPGFPLMYFKENRYSQDLTNWWIPNPAGMEAMLRSAGYEIAGHPEQEFYICKRGKPGNNQPSAVYPIK